MRTESVGLELISCENGDPQLTKKLSPLSVRVWCQSFSSMENGRGVMFVTCVLQFSRNKQENFEDGKSRIASWFMLSKVITQKVSSPRAAS